MRYKMLMYGDKIVLLNDAVSCPVAKIILRQW